MTRSGTEKTSTGRGPRVGQERQVQVEGYGRDNDNKVRWDNKNKYRQRTRRGQGQQGKLQVGDQEWDN